MHTITVYSYCVHTCLKIKRSTWNLNFISKFTPLTDIRDDKGRSPLDVALASYSHIDVPLYLINHGCGDDKDKAKLLCRACQQNRLDIVKDLVEEQKLDPKGKYYWGEHERAPHRRDKHEKICICV